MGVGVAWDCVCTYIPLALCSLLRKPRGVGGGCKEMCSIARPG
jgi:hypothetical protein